MIHRAQNIYTHSHFSEMKLRNSNPPSLKLHLEAGNTRSLQASFHLEDLKQVSIKKGKRSNSIFNFKASVSLNGFVGSIIKGNQFPKLGLERTSCKIKTLAPIYSISTRFWWLSTLSLGKKGTPTRNFVQNFALGYQITIVFSFNSTYYRFPVAKYEA